MIKTLQDLSFSEEFSQEDLDLFEESGITVNPKDYYYAFDHQGQDSIVVTPKKLFDKQGYWSDSGYVCPIVIEVIFDQTKSEYFDLLEATLEWPSNKSEDDIRKEFNSLGFIENPNIL